MKRTGMILAVVMTTVMVLTGCLQLKKDPVGTERFIKTAEEESMEIKDVSKEFHAIEPSSEEDTTEEGVLEATVATHPDGWKVVFVKYTGSEIAKSEFEKSNEDYTTEAPTGMEKTVEAGNYKRMYTSQAGEFIYMSYIEDSILYAMGEEKYETDIREFAKKMKY